MRGWLGTTDGAWFRFLREQVDRPEVNFWFPSGMRTFKAIDRGDLFFFKLKAPDNAIGGFGIFERYSVLPLWLAWEAFGVRNGTPDEASLRAKIAGYRRVDPRVAGGLEIGCAILTQPVFFEDAAWVKVASDWHRSIVVGKGYDLTRGEGERMYRECLERSTHEGITSRPGEYEPHPRFGKPSLVAPRLGQGAFRIAVTEAYARSCAVTTEHSLPVLEAAHIRPYAEGGAHSVSNGMLLRSDVHRLFDLGYVTVTPDYRVRVSEQLRERWGNGKIYSPYDGQSVAVPDRIDERPDPLLLKWHSETVFQG